MPAAVYFAAKTCGAPFTVASYLVEGGPSREHALTKAMMFGAPDVWDALMSRIADLAGEFLRRQVLAGASAVLPNKVIKAAEAHFAD